MQNSKAFTLVELIVVITILAILWTIAFLAFQWYSKDSRDSVRISDINSLESTLELYVLEKWTYPEPTTWLAVTYTWTEVWIQGTVWDSVMTNLWRITPKPTDPLTSNEYTYSLLNTDREFELWAILENSPLSWILSPNGGKRLQNSIVSETNAWNNMTAYIQGTYNWAVAKVSTWSTTYILAVPTIIATEVWPLLDIITNKKLVFNWFSNMPPSYNWTNWYTASWWFDYNSTSSWNILVYTWPITDLKTDSNLKILADNLKIAYQTTDIESQWIYYTIINLDTSDTTILKTTIWNLANNTLWSKVDTNTTTSSTPLTYQQQWLCDIPDIHVPTWCTEWAVWCYIIAWCNLWTTTSWTGTASYWWLYQWWNNYDFRWWQFTNWDDYSSVWIEIVGQTWSTLLYSPSTYIHDVFRTRKNPDNPD